MTTLGTDRTGLLQAVAGVMAAGARARREREFSRSPNDEDR